MTKQGLKFISDKLTAANIPYAFMVWTKQLSYPYFVGEYIESEPMYEYGESESTFILTGTTNGSWLTLESIKAQIKELFGCEGLTHIFEDGTAIAVIYQSSKPIPTSTDDLKRMQINLKVKEWRVI